MGLIGCKRGREEERRQNRKFVLWVRRPNVAPHYVLVDGPPRERMIAPPSKVYEAVEPQVVICQTIISQIFRKHSCNRTYRHLKSAARIHQIFQFWLSLHVLAIERR